MPLFYNEKSCANKEDYEKLDHPGCNEVSLQSEFATTFRCENQEEATDFGPSRVVANLLRNSDYGRSVS